MALRSLIVLVWVLNCALAAPAPVPLQADKSAGVVPQNLDDQQPGDLKTDASSGYGYRNTDLGGSYPGNYGVTGYGLLEDRSYGGYGGYDNTYGYNGYDGNNKGYNRGYNPGFASNPGYDGYKNYGGASGYGGAAGYGGASGYGGYGGYAGNGGLSSYNGYSNPYYQGAYNLGYGYYNKKPYGSIYNGITPSLVTGYRGYSRR